MRFFRERSKLGWIALFAFAMQAIVAIAHTHVHATPAPELLETRAITFGICRPGDQEPCAPSNHHDGQKDCTICWATNLAGSALLNAAPAIEQLPRLGGAPLALPLIAELPGDTSVHFRARAPPIHRST